MGRPSPGCAWTRRSTWAAAAGRAADDEQALAEGLDGLKAAYLCQGDAAALAGVLAELVPLLRRHGDLFRLQWSEFESAFMAIAAADWGRAAAAIASAIEVNRRGGYPDSAAWYVAHQGWLAGLRGHDAEALAAGRRALALALAQDSEHAWWVAATCAMLSETVLRTGDRAAVIALLERGPAAAQDHGAEAYLVCCVAPLAALTGSRELLAEAAALLDQAATASGAWITGDAAYLAVARAWVDRDDPERARATLARCWPSPSGCPGRRRSRPAWSPTAARSPGPAIQRRPGAPCAAPAR